MQITQLRASNVAIGKTNSTYALDVQGDLNFNGNVRQNGNAILSDAISIGTIMSWTSTNIPQYYLACDGAAISRTEYSKLYAIIGTTYGIGDGFATFNVPDLRGRVMVGTGSTTYTDSGISTIRPSESYIHGRKGGEETHTITTSEMPAHTHSMDSGGNHRHSMAGADGWSTSGFVRMTDRWATSVGAWTNHDGNHVHTISSIGGSNAVSIVQPYTVVQYIIKALPQFNSTDSTLNYWTQSDASTYTTNTNVGIGTSNPSGLLHVGSILSPNTLVVASNGCVGIGTSNPTSSLTVVGDINLTGSLNGTISISNLSFSNLSASNINVNVLNNRFNIPVIGYEPPFLQEINSPYHWEGITPITSTTINNFGWKNGVTKDITSYINALWGGRYYMINFGTFTTTNTLPSSSANYCYTPITVDPTTHNQVFMCIMNGESWRGMNAFVLNSNLDPVFPLGVQTNTVNFVNGSTTRLGPNNTQAIAQTYREWISWMLPNHIIAPNLVPGTSNVLRIGFCSGANGGTDAWISGIKCCPNPYANTYQAAHNLHWGSVSSMWGNGGFPAINWNWNGDLIAHMDTGLSRVINVLVPQVSSTNSDLLIGFTTHNNTWYDWEGRLILPYMGSLISIIPNPIQIGRYGHASTGRSVYRRAYGFILPYSIWSNAANIVTYQGAQALQFTFSNLAGINSLHIRAMYSELVQPFYTS
jgi:microcystin-dependent protein